MRRNQQRAAATDRPEKRNTIEAPEERVSRTQPAGRGPVRQRDGLGAARPPPRRGRVVDGRRPATTRAAKRAQDMNIT